MILTCTGVCKAAQNQPVHLTPITTTVLVTKLGRGHDGKVKEWQDSLTKHLVSTLDQVCYQSCLHVFQNVV